MAAASHARRALDARVVRARDGVRRTPVQFPLPLPPAPPLVRMLPCGLTALSPSMA